MITCVPVACVRRSTMFPPFRLTKTAIGCPLIELRMFIKFFRRILEDRLRVRNYYLCETLQYVLDDVAIAVGFFVALILSC